MLIKYTDVANSVVSHKVPAPHFGTNFIKVYPNEQPTLQWASFIWLMKHIHGVWETQPHVLCISEVRNFALYFTEGYNKAALCRQTQLMQCSYTSSYTMLMVTLCYSECCVAPGIDFKAAGGSIICYCLSTLCWYYLVAVNMTWALNCG